VRAGDSTVIAATCSASIRCGEAVSAAAAASAPAEDATPPCCSSGEQPLPAAGGTADAGGGLRCSFAATDAASLLPAPTEGGPMAPAGGSSGAAALDALEGPDGCSPSTPRLLAGWPPAPAAAVPGRVRRRNMSVRLCRMVLPLAAAAGSITAEGWRLSAEPGSGAVSPSLSDAAAATEASRATARTASIASSGNSAAAWAASSCPPSSTSSSPSSSWPYPPSSASGITPTAGAPAARPAVSTDGGGSGGGAGRLEEARAALAAEDEFPSVRKSKAELLIIAAHLEARPGSGSPPVAAAVYTGAEGAPATLMSLLASSVVEGALTCSV